MHLTCIIPFYVFVFMEVVCHETTQSTYQLSVTTTFGHTLDTAQYILFFMQHSAKKIAFLRWQIYDYVKLLTARAIL